MKAAIYLITPPSTVRLLKKCDSLAEAMREMRTTPCPYESSMFIVDEKFNIITSGYILDIYKDGKLINSEYCEEKGLAEFTAKVLRRTGYETTIS